jgi:hypothetical protein
MPRNVLQVKTCGARSADFCATTGAKVTAFLGRQAPIRPVCSSQATVSRTVSSMGLG